MRWIQPQTQELDLQGSGEAAVHLITAIGLCVVHSRIGLTHQGRGVRAGRARFGNPDADGHIQPAVVDRQHNGLHG